MNRKLLTTIGLLYTILLIYASLMPFDFSINIDLHKRSMYFWSYWPINPGARISGSDLLSNLVLYIPLGWMMGVRLRLGNTGVFLSMVFTTLFCSLISICIELLQMATITRVASASDWLLNTMSGCMGAVGGMVYGKEIWMKAIKFLRQSWKTRPIVIAIGVFAGLLTADAFSPYIPTILLKQVWQSFKASNFDIVSGFAVHPWHWWFVQHIFVYTTLTLLLTGCIKQKSGFIFFYAAFMAAVFSFFLEFGKFFIISRSFNIANILASWSGCCFAIIIGFTFKGIVNTNKKLELSICFILVYLFYLAWFPFDFACDYHRIQRVFSNPVKLLPLYDYAMGATLNHARLFLQSIFLPGILIYILRIRFKWFENPESGIWLAAIFCGILGLLQEGGQLFLASRTPAATDIYCFALGGGIGAWIKRPQILI